MKKFFFILSLITVCSASTFAQCDKKIVWTAAKAEFLDDSGKVEKNVDEHIVVKTNTKTITITHDGDVNDTLKGTVSASTCNWKQAFKDGKSVLKAAFVERDNQSIDGELRIEGKDGKIFIYLQIETPEGKKLIKIYIDNYKEEA